MLICHICNTKTNTVHYSDWHKTHVCEQCWRNGCYMETLKIEADKAQYIVALESQLTEAEQELHEYKTQISVCDEIMENQRQSIQNLSVQLDQMTKKYDNAWNAIRALHTFLHPSN